MIRRLKAFFSFAWHMIGVNVRLLHGMWKLTRLPQPAVTFFGGARLTSDSPYAQKARALAKMLAGEGFSIITGGGPGIMEAANLGAMEYLRECQEGGACKYGFGSFGIGLTRLNDEEMNPNLQDYIVMEHFFERKWLLVRYSVGFAVFPGGFGTYDELFEVLVLMQCHRMPNTPVVLVGVSFWTPFQTWVKEHAIKEGLLEEKYLDLFVITDDVEEAFCLIQGRCARKTDPSFKP